MHNYIVNGSNYVFFLASVSAMFLDLPMLHGMIFSGHACVCLFVFVRASHDGD